MTASSTEEESCQKYSHFPALPVAVLPVMPFLWYRSTSTKGTCHGCCSKSRRYSLVIQGLPGPQLTTQHSRRIIAHARECFHASGWLIGVRLFLSSSHADDARKSGSREIYTSHARQLFLSTAREFEMSLRCGSLQGLVTLFRD